MLEQIIQTAQSQRKNILILSSARSGSHALGSEFAYINKNIINLGEICVTGRSENPHDEISLITDTQALTVAQIVQLVPKFNLSRNVQYIKSHAVIVCLRRKDKVKQFASAYYFRKVHKGYWFNINNTQIQCSPGQFEATDQDILQFIQEQIVDDFFLPDFNICYEDINFTQKTFVKNSFPFPLEQIFSNLDYVKQRLSDWEYHPDHLLQTKTIK